MICMKFRLFQRIGNSKNSRFNIFDWFVAISIPKSGIQPSYSYSKQMFIDHFSQFHLYKSVLIDKFYNWEFRTRINFLYKCVLLLYFHFSLSFLRHSFIYFKHWDLVKKIKLQDKNWQFFMRPTFRLNKFSFIRIPI